VEAERRPLGGGPCRFAFDRDADDQVRPAIHPGARSRRTYGQDRPGDDRVAGGRPASACRPGADRREAPHRARPDGTVDHRHQVDGDRGPGVARSGPGIRRGPGQRVDGPVHRRRGCGPLVGVPQGRHVRRVHPGRSGRRQVAADRDDRSRCGVLEVAPDDRLVRLRPGRRVVTAADETGDGHRDDGRGVLSDAPRRASGLRDQRAREPGRRGHRLPPHRAAAGAADHRGRVPQLPGRAQARKSGNQNSGFADHHCPRGSQDRRRTVAGHSGAAAGCVRPLRQTRICCARCC
jgi:hypothetical protein